MNLDKNSHGNTLDGVDIAASSLCAIHCILSPLIALTPVVSIRQAAVGGAQLVFVVVSVAIGLTSLLPGYLRHHWRSQGLASFMVGVALMLVGKFVADEGSYMEGSMMILGAVLIIVGHIINLVLFLQEVPGLRTETPCFIPDGSLSPMSLASR